MRVRRWASSSRASAPLDALRHPIRYLENAQRRGHSGSRNAGLRAARGRYIAYLDDDDTFHPEHLATLMAALADGRHAVAYSDAERARVGAGGEVLACDFPYSSDFDPDALLLTNYIPMLCVVHERACADAVAGVGGALFDETLPVLEDWDSAIRLSRRFAFVHVPRVTCRFTVRTDGSSVTHPTLARVRGHRAALAPPLSPRDCERATRAASALSERSAWGPRAPRRRAGCARCRRARRVRRDLSGARRGAPGPGVAARSLTLSA